MQDAYPQTEGGQKVYGISAFPAWDGLRMSMASQLSVMYGWDSEYSSSVIETKVDASETPRKITDDESMYKRVVKFLFSANQMGIMDPDSATQTWDAISAKWKEDGRILFSPWAWSVSGFNTTENADADDFKGYASVWPEDATMSIYPDMYTGAVTSLSIGKATSNLDAALKFLNFYYTYECSDLLYNGPKGVLWDVDGSGQRYVTDAGWNIIDNDGDFPDGGKASSARNVLNHTPMSRYLTLAQYPGQQMDYTLWESSITRNPSKLKQDWRTANGNAIDMLDRAKKSGMVLKGSQAINMVELLGDDMSATVQQIGDVVKSQSWLAVFAKDEAEFEAIWDQMQADTEGLGMNDYYTWYLGAWETAKANAAKYQP
jgi:putative aldouronate transport system substrate-binding protein